MKEHLAAAVRSFVCALVSAALGALLVALMLALYDIERTVMLDIRTWVLALALQAIVNELLLARGTSLLMFLAINGALLFAFAGRLVSHTVFIPGSAGFPVFLQILFYSSGIAGAAAAQKDPGSNVFVRCADMLILSCAAYLGAAFALGDALNLPILALSLITIVLTMILTASLRAGGESDSVVRGTGIGGWLVLLALLALCLLCTAGILGASAGHMDSLIDLLKFVWQIIYRLGRHALYALAWFLSLFVGKYKHQSSAPVLDMQDSSDLAPITIPDTPQWVVYLFWAMIAAVVIALVAVILYALAGTKLTRKRAIRRKRRVTRKSHFFSALRAMLAAFFASVSFEAAYRFGAPSVHRLYILAVRTGRLHRLSKMRGETPGAYLRRYHSALTAQQAESSLDALADMLDAALYGGAKPQLSRSEFDRYAQQIRLLRAPEKTAPNPPD